MRKHRLAVQQLLSGDQLHLNVFEFPGTNPAAPSVYIQAALHGAELQGNIVIEQLLQYFLRHPPLGRVVLVPFCNPIGAGKKQGDFTEGRYDPVSGNNWNRCFVDLTGLAQTFLQSPDASTMAWDKVRKKFGQLLIDTLEARRPQLTSAAHRLNWQLQRLAVEHDIVLDLHCDTDSVVYLYAPEYAVRAAVHLDIAFALAVPESFMGSMEDAIFSPWTALAQALNFSPEQKQSLPMALTLELGNQEIVSRSAAERQTLGILNFLAWKKVIAAREYKQNKVSYSLLKDVLDIPAPAAGISEFLQPLGKACRQGDALVRITNLAALQEDGDWSETRHEVLAPLDGIPLTTVSSASVLPGTEIVKYMTQVKTIE